VWVAAIFVVAYGLGNGIAVVVNSLLVQRGIPDHLRGRAFTLAMSLTYSALFIGMLAGGFISDAYGARWAWGVASMMAGVAAVASYALARGIPVGEADEVEPFPIVSAAAPDPAELGALHE
jgi:MFS family permease